MATSTIIGKRGTRSQPWGERPLDISSHPDWKLSDGGCNWRTQNQLDANTDIALKPCHHAAANASWSNASRKHEARSTFLFPIEPLSAYTHLLEELDMAKTAIEPIILLLQRLCHTKRCSCERYLCTAHIANLADKSNFGWICAVRRSDSPEWEMRIWYFN